MTDASLAHHNISELTFHVNKQLNSTQAEQSND